MYVSQLLSFPVVILFALLVLVILLYWFLSLLYTDLNLFILLNKVVVDRQTNLKKKREPSRTPEKPKFVWLPSICGLGDEIATELLLLCDSRSQAAVAGHMHMP